VPPLKRVANRPTWLLSRVNLRAQALLANAFAAHDVRGYDFRVLAALDQFGPSSQADVGRHTGIDRSDVVATVNALVSRGLARRTPDPVDARRNVVTITSSGRRMLERLDGAVDEVQEALLAPLSSAERRSFVRLLRKLS
jgi:MarR family transcriptional regulator, lower aerobic nicotinate degradation pathway regulator